MRRPSDAGRVRRRRILRVLGGVGTVGLAGCLGDEGDDDAGGDDATDDAAPADGDDADDGDDSEEDDGGAADDPGDAAEDDADDEGEAEDAEDLLPSEVDFEPEEGWNDDHHDVAVPDEPGTMIAAIGDERIELSSLPDAPCSGGPVDEATYDETIEEDEWSNDPFFRALAGFGTERDEGEFPDAVAVGLIQSFVVPERGTLELFRRDSIEVSVRGDVTNVFGVEYRERPDGTVEDEPPAEMVADAVVDEPMIRWGRDGVVTAVGEIPDEAANETDVPPGPFEIGFRCEES